MMSALKAESEDYSPGACAFPRCLVVPQLPTAGRLDQVLASLMSEFSRSRIQAWIRQGRVAVAGEHILDPKFRLVGGEAIRVEGGDNPAEAVHQGQDIPLAICYEDEHIVIVDKPPGLVVHPGNGNPQGTLLNALLHRYPALQEVPRAGIVHRLDKDTSGLMVVAKNLLAQTDLVRQLQARTVKRQYLALVHGQVPGAGEVDAPIGRHPTQRTRMAVVAGGKEARTRYEVVERFPGLTLVQCHLDTGRTHQIRVHMAAIGFPLVGDPVYGRRVGKVSGPDFHRQALHATRLGLIHPASAEAMTWTVPLPADFTALLDWLRTARGAA